jgi:hypothetical protein
MHFLRGSRIGSSGLISHDEDGHCFFARQPTTEDETSAAIRGVWASCCGAVRYAGDVIANLLLAIPK